jgi:hypothetical protein
MCHATPVNPELQLSRRLRQSRDGKKKSKVPIVSSLPRANSAVAGPVKTLPIMSSREAGNVRVFFSKKISL